MYFKVESLIRGILSAIIFFCSALPLLGQDIENLVEEIFPQTYSALEVTDSGNLNHQVLATINSNSDGYILSYLAASKMLSVAISEWTGADQDQAFSILTELPEDQKQLSANPSDYLLANSILLMHFTENSDLSGFGDVAAVVLEHLNPSLASSLAGKYSTERIDLRGFDTGQFEVFGELFSGAARHHLEDSGALLVAKSIRDTHAQAFGNGSRPLDSLPGFGETAANTENVFPVMSPGSIWRQSAELMDAMAQQGSSIDALASGTATGGDNQSQCTSQQRNACRAAAQIVVQTPYLTYKIVTDAIDTAEKEPWEILVDIANPQKKIERMEELVEESEELADTATKACLRAICDTDTDNEDQSDEQPIPSNEETPPAEPEPKTEQSPPKEEGQEGVANPITDAVDPEACAEIHDDPENCPQEGTPGGEPEFCQPSMSEEEKAASGCTPLPAGLTDEIVVVPSVEDDVISVPGTEPTDEMEVIPPVLGQDEEILPPNLSDGDL